MKHLLRKEFSLAMHPTAIMFIFLAGMVLIPNYPYYVTLFYICLAVFFTCLTGRENNDVFYTMSLPVAKKDIVKARYIFVILLQMAQMILVIPFSIIRQGFNMPGNMVGVDANIVFFGFSFVMLAIFNIIFFNIYYKDINKVGKAFIWSSIAMFTYMLIAEASAHAIPFVKNYLDTKDPEYLAYKLIVLGVGILVYIVLTFLSYKKSVKSFEVYDL